MPNTLAAVTSRSSASRTRFTLDGDDALEEQLARTCSDVLAGVRQHVPVSQLQAILLGGGYGRGEGGVLKTKEGDRPYNDLEFYVCVRNKPFRRATCQSRLHHLGSVLTAASGIDVEFKVITLRTLQRASPSMFYYDLMCGHRWVLGREQLLNGCEHLRRAEALPLAEGTRLLMNRFTGLLLAREKLQSSSLPLADADFVGRNLAKVQLALGDAVLTAFGQYHWSCLERQARLQEIAPALDDAWCRSIVRHHTAGVDFKLHPQRTAPELFLLRERLDELTALALEVWLWLENRRLQHPFATPAAYALCDANKCPETNSWRNLLINLATLQWPARRRWTKAGRHPRERLLNALTLLLWEKEELSPPVLRVLQDSFSTKATDPRTFRQAYLALWERFR